jgi:hypothetical protein
VFIHFYCTGTTVRDDSVASTAVCCRQMVLVWEESKVSGGSHSMKAWSPRSLIDVAYMAVGTPGHHE